MIIDSTIPTPAEGYRIEEMEGEILLFHPKSTATVYMNQTAALVWQLCDGNRSVADIVSILTQSFPDEDSRINSDVLSALDMFQNQGALVI